MPCYFIDQLKYYFLFDAVNAIQALDVNYTSTGIHKLPQIQIAYAFSVVLSSLGSFKKLIRMNTKAMTPYPKATSGAAPTLISNA